MYIYLKNRIDVFWDELDRSPQKCVQNKKKKTCGRNWKKRGKKFILKYC